MIHKKTRPVCKDDLKRLKWRGRIERVNLFVVHREGERYGSEKQTQNRYYGLAACGLGLGRRGDSRGPPSQSPKSKKLM